MDESREFRQEVLKRLQQLEANRRRESERQEEEEAMIEGLAAFSEMPTDVVRSIVDDVRRDRARAAGNRIVSRTIPILALVFVSSGIGVWFASRAASHASTANAQSEQLTSGQSHSSHPVAITTHFSEPIQPPPQYAPTTPLGPTSFTIASASQRRVTRTTAINEEQMGLSWRIRGAAAEQVLVSAVGDTHLEVSMPVPGTYEVELIATDPNGSEYVTVSNSVTVDIPRPPNPKAKLWLRPDRTVVRSQIENDWPGSNPTWVVKYNGKTILERNAAGETEFSYWDEPAGMYEVYLIAVPSDPDPNSTYVTISNTIRFTVTPEERSKVIQQRLDRRGER